MNSAKTGRSFADFAETLSFVKGSNSKSSPLAPKNDEQRLLIPSWGSFMSSTQPVSTSASSRDPSPLKIGSPSNQNNSTLGKFAQYAKNGFSAVRSSASSAATRTQERVEEVQSSFSRYLYFTASCLVGAFLIFLAFIFLPMVVLAPQKFALLFTLGSLFLINGLGLLKGYRPLFYHLIETDRIIFSLGYTLSLVATLYATIGLKSYFLTLVFAIIQLCCLMALLVSYIAGSTRVVSFIKGAGVGVIRKLFGGGGEILPL